MDFVQAILDGIADGSVYGALGMALALVYQSTGVINLAQGDMAMLSTFGAFGLSRAGVPIVWAVVAAAVGSFAGGMLVERVVIRPVEHRDPLSIVAVTLGLAITLNALAALVWGGDTHAFPSIFGNGGFDAGVRISADATGTSATLLSVVGLLWFLLTKTRLGLIMRASALDPATSRLLGIPVGPTLMFGWGLAAFIGALAGALVAPGLFLDVNLMSGVLVYALAAVALGGLDSPLGAITGGWIIGVTSSLASSYPHLGLTQMPALVPFTTILIVLLARPTGLFGTTEVKRA